MNRGVPCPSCIQRGGHGHEQHGFNVRSGVPDARRRAMVAARLANFKHGGDRKSDQGPNSDFDVSLKQSAELLNVGRATVADAKLIEREAPKLAEEVMRGEKALFAADPEAFHARLEGRLDRELSANVIPMEQRGG